MPPVTPPGPAATGPQTPPEPVEQLSRATNLLKAIIALLGLLLPILVVTKIVEIPPALAELVKLITFPSSVVAVAAIVLLGETIRRWSPRKSVTVFAALAVLGSAAALSVYLIGPPLLYECEGKRRIKPIFPSDNMVEMIDPHDDDYCKALRRYPDRNKIEARLEKDSRLSVVVLVVLMVLSVLSLVAAMVGAAWKVVVGTEPAARRTARQGRRR